MAERSPEEIEKRRTRRAERRQKQRIANVERAKKMHSARLAREGNAGSDSVQPPLNGLHIGCSGWYYWHWKGKLYPADAPSKEWFSIYAQEFDTVELNAPFYSWPTLATVRTWLRQANPKFIYTVKVCELITHVKRFDDTRILIADFAYIADLLGPRMGCFLFQLPPSIRYSPEMLRTIIDQLDPRQKNVLEFRHKSWWNAEVFSAFRNAGIIFCSCSGPRLPNELVQTTNVFIYGFMESNSGTAMTIVTLNWRYGLNASDKATRKLFGPISTTIAMATLSRMQSGYWNCCSDRRDTV